MAIFRFLTVLAIAIFYGVTGFLNAHFINLPVSALALVSCVLIIIEFFKPFRNKHLVRNALVLLAFAVTGHILYTYSASDLNPDFQYSLLAITLLLGIMFSNIPLLLTYYGTVAVSLVVIFILHADHISRHSDFIKTVLLLAFILLFYIPVLIQRILNENVLRKKVEEKTKELQLINRALENKVERGVQEIRNKDAILIQQGKLSAMGEMMANIAHQWKQPLNSLGVIIQNLKEYFDRGSWTTTS